MIRNLSRLWWLEILLLTALLTLSFYIFKLPLRFTPIAFYDDGEILYHAFSIAKGKIPYLDQVSHHFLGYTLPIIYWGNIFGFGPYLVRQYALFNQVLAGIGVFILLRQFVRPGWSMIAALLYISAREPFVKGFPIQYEINLLYIYILLFAVIFLKTKLPRYLYLSFILSGLAFTFDQRALLISLIPILGLFYQLRSSNSSAQYKNNSLFMWIFCCAFSWLILPLGFLLYLWKHHALDHFIEQTFLYPAFFRVGSFSLLALAQEGFVLHKHLFQSSICFTWLGLIGYFVLIFDHTIKENVGASFRSILLILPLPLFMMAASGSRDYDYYTVIWFPYFAILAGLLSFYVDRSSKFLKSAFLILLLSCLTPAYAKSIILSNNPLFNSPHSDGTEETAEFLNNNLGPADTIYVWGYRLDLYVRVNKLSHYPFANQIMIHPDRKILGADRDRHIYQPYEEKFLTLLNQSLPTYLVIFNRKEYLDLHSKSFSKITELVNTDYELVFYVDGQDFSGGAPRFEVYKLLGASKSRDRASAAKHTPLTAE